MKESSVVEKGEKRERGEGRGERGEGRGKERG